LAASTFSPDGKIFQVEYAQKAVDQGGTVVAIAGRDGVVTAVDRTVTSKLHIETSQSRVSNVNDYIGFTGAGIYPDCQQLLDYCQDESAKYLRSYRTLIPVRQLAEAVAEYVHIFTLGLHRPYGACVFVTSWAAGEPSVYMIDPSGMCNRYQAWSVGKHRQAAKTEIEKIASKLPEMGMDQLVKEAVRILITVRDESTSKKNLHVDVGWVGERTGGKHEIVDAKTVAEAEQWAQSQLEEEDMDMD